MNREELKKLGLTDDQVEKVMKEHGKTVNSIKDRADKADSLESQIDDMKGQIKDRDKQLSDLKKVDPKALQAEIERLEDVNKTTATEHQAQLDKQAKDFAIESALRDAKAHNPKLAKGALSDLESITLKDGKLIGFDEQLSAAKESDPYLFTPEQDADAKPVVKGAKPAEGNQQNTQPTSVGSKFAQSANDQNKPVENTIWD